MRINKSKEFIKQYKENVKAYTLISVAVSIGTALMAGGLFVLNEIFDLGRKYPVNEIIVTIIATVIFGFISLMITFVLTTFIDVYID